MALKPTRENVGESEWSASIQSTVTVNGSEKLTGVSVTMRRYEIKSEKRTRYNLPKEHPMFLQYYDNWSLPRVPGEKDEEFLARVKRSQEESKQTIDYIFRQESHSIPLWSGKSVERALEEIDEMIASMGKIRSYLAGL